MLIVDGVHFMDRKERAAQIIKRMFLDMLVDYFLVELVSFCFLNDMRTDACFDIVVCSEGRVSHLVNNFNKFRISIFVELIA